MHSPLISVIIPAHNGEKYLAEAIDSVLSQSYKNYEIWVLDNGSNDHTRQIIETFSQVKTRYTHLANPAIARNEGLLYANGDYIAFLDQDDRWHPEKLTNQVHFLEKHKEYGAVIGLQKLYLQSGYKKPHWLKQAFLDEPQIAYLPSALLARRAIFSTTGVFDIESPLTSDVAWFFKAKHMGILIGIIDEILVERRIHEENHSHNWTALQKELLVILKKSLADRRKISHFVLQRKNNER